MAASVAVGYQSSPNTEESVVKTEENKRIDVGSSSDGSVITNLQSQKGPGHSGSALKMENVVHMFSSLKLNHMAEEFVPSSSSPIYHNQEQLESGFNYLPPLYYQNSLWHPTEERPYVDLSWRNVYTQDRRRLMSLRSPIDHREDGYRIRRTVYVSEIDHNVDEERLADLFSIYGQVNDCRVCGDSYTPLRFAFLEFANESSARAALRLSGTKVGKYQIWVSPSKTAILPVNPAFLAKSQEEKEKCTRTVCCTNIDKQVTQHEVKCFFETRCGEVSCLRLLGDEHHSTRIAFVEFVRAESAVRALNCCGHLLGSQLIRVNPSKTPVRSRGARSFPTN